MEFKHNLSMFWISLLWLVSVCPSAFGDRHGMSVASHQQRTIMSPVVIRRFPMDLLAEATGAVEKGSSSKMKTDEDKKTLSQQVADGKYGLIQKELFPNPVRRPGVLSYESNSEVPKDTLNNLGGLNKSDIWLAENHLLVLKGGVFPVLEALPEYSKPAWPPIDDYSAPRRPVKLPKHPKVPPPFPVQLTDGGPLQILGTNFTRTLNDSFLPPPYAVSSLEGYDPGSGPFFPPPYPDPANASAGETPLSAPPYYPPIPGDNKSEGLPPQFPFPINGALPPFFDSLPPGSAILPPPNITDQYDEDDLSIYYPPPYSFYYPQDNSTAVPPGPLVPGIVLPPPPDFFTIQKKPSPATKTGVLTDSPKQTVRVTTPPPPTIVVVSKSQKPSIAVTKDFPSKPPTRRIKPSYKTAIPTYIPEVTSKKQPPQKTKSVNVTILRPIKTTKKPPTVYMYDNNIPNKPFAEYGPPPPPSPPRHHHKISVSTTKIPLRAYFSTSSETDTNLVTSVPEQQHYTTRSALKKHRTKPSTQFYYYDDAPITNSISTPYPVEQKRPYFNLSQEYYTRVNDGSSKYTADPIVHVQQAPLQPQYYYVPNKPYVTQRPRTKIIQQQQQTLAPDNFKTHLVHLQEQIQTYQRPPKQYKQTVFEFNNQREVPAPKQIQTYQRPPKQYKQTVFEFNGQQQAIATPKPIYQYREQDIPRPKPVYQYSEQDIPTSKPVYQYSFEVANYREQHERLQQTPNFEQTHQNKYRNAPKYTVQVEPAVEITTESPLYQNTPAPIYYQEDYPDNSQPLSPQRLSPQRLPPQTFYTNKVPDYSNYQEQQKYSSPVTPHPFEDNSYKATPNPVYQPYYTKQDEQYFDDMTKNYFTTFGKKISSTSTTPIPAVHVPSINAGQRQVVYSPQEENIRIRTSRPSYIPQSNIKGNILVNYVNQRPATQNIPSEYVQIKQRQQQPRYPQVTKQVPQFVPSYQSSENVRQKTPQNIQTIRAIGLPAQSIGEGKPGSFISYELPGDDGAHFYFLTPQLTQKDDRGGITYYYTQPSSSRIRRDSQTRSV